MYLKKVSSAIGAADKCITGIGCDMSLADKLFAKLCGPKTSCDIKQAVKCIYLASPAAPAGYHMLQGVVHDFKKCMVGAGCKKSAGKISNQICAVSHITLFDIFSYLGFLAKQNISTSVDITVFIVVVATTATNTDVDDTI
ncbi:Hypothetical predicted protein [Octopus vulgaris]|uniref:Uncharacterized protein n=1 Tax=Octopus vulgaris TaxID=6645 RepID=A0AA36FIM8_OCTVU|nr:Hypothetical predicted protein [Octopus vulgaris]CAI9740242.1 Hypothetical predicted protein [Octopus vulgaris]